MASSLREPCPKCSESATHITKYGNCICPNDHTWISKSVTNPESALTPQKNSGIDPRMTVNPQRIISPLSSRQLLLFGILLVVILGGVIGIGLYVPS